MCIYRYDYIIIYIYTRLLYIHPDLQTKLEADENSQAVKKIYKTNSSEYWMDLYLSSTSRHTTRGTPYFVTGLKLHESIPLCPGRTSVCGRETDLQSTLDRPGKQC